MESMSCPCRLGKLCAGTSVICAGKIDVVKADWNQSEGLELAVRPVGGATGMRYQDSSCVLGADEKFSLLETTRALFRERMDFLIQRGSFKPTLQSSRWIEDHLPSLGKEK